jgi:hypothetical protein
LGPTSSNSRRQNRKSVLLEMVLPFCIACDFLNCGPELVHAYIGPVGGFGSQLRSCGLRGSVHFCIWRFLHVSQWIDSLIKEFHQDKGVKLTRSRKKSIVN